MEDQEFDPGSLNPESMFLTSNDRKKKKKEKYEVVYRIQTMLSTLYTYLN